MHASRPGHPSTLAATLLLATACGAAPIVPAPSADQAAAAPIVRGMQWNLTGVSSAMFGDCPNFSQIGNGDFMAVVSRDHGRFSRTGALIAWHYPSHGDNRLRVAQVGVGSPGSVQWADDLLLEGQRVLPDTALVETTLRDPAGRFAVVVEDVAWPGADDVAARRVTVRNRTARPLTGLHVVFHGHFALSLTGLGDRLRYDAAAGALLQHNAGAGLAVAVGAATA
ncbi:MAG: hypothetical protein FJZ01_27455, partial [Candidatus Sericytochromatia bacterium]|nr:hypothetical protein [Candidatus Tanganyikabacteria bacterium]